MQIQVHQTLVHPGAWLEVEWVEVTGFRPFNSRGAECGEANELNLLNKSDTAVNVQPLSDILAVILKSTATTLSLTFSPLYTIASCESP